jgi:hypothetical protein
MWHVYAREELRADSGREPEAKRPLRRPRSGWESTIKIEI